MIHSINYIRIKPLFVYFFAGFYLFNVTIHLPRRAYDNFNYSC